MKRWLRPQQKRFERSLLRSAVLTSSSDFSDHDRRALLFGRANLNLVRILSFDRCSRRPFSPDPASAASFPVFHHPGMLWLFAGAISASCRSAFPPSARPFTANSSLHHPHVCSIPLTPVV